MGVPNLYAYYLATHTVIINDWLYGAYRLELVMMGLDGLLDNARERHSGVLNGIIK